MSKVLGVSLGPRGSGGDVPGTSVDVVHVMASGAVGGGAEHLFGIISALRKRDVRSAVVIGPDGPVGERLEGFGIPVFRLPMMGSRADLRIVRKLGRLTRDLQPALVHAHGTRAGLFVALTGRRPYVYTAHGLAFGHGTRLFQPVRALAEFVVCLGSAAVISVSSEDLQSLRRIGAVSRSKGYHIPNALDTDRFSPGDRLTARAKLGLPTDATLVGTVARLVPQKGVAHLIDAIPSIPGAELVVAGDGPLRPELERRAAAAGIRAHFLGLRGDVPDVLRSLDVFVLPSRWEGEPIALLEALSCGIPVVASRLPGVVEVLGEREAALLVPVAEAPAIAVAASRLINDSSLANGLVAAGHERIVARNWGTAAARLHTVYARLAPALRRPNTPPQVARDPDDLEADEHCKAR